MFKVIGYSAVPILAVLVTLLTGFSGVFNFGQGFPLVWKTGLGCPGPHLQFDSLRLCTPITYNWVAFGLDAIFYTVIGYALISVEYILRLGYVKYRGGNSTSLPPN